MCNRGCPRKLLARSAALWGDREETGKQTKKESKRGECLIPGAFIISHRVAEKKSGKEEARGRVYADQPFMTTGVVIYIFFLEEGREKERDREGSGGEEWRKRRPGDARDISNFLITPRGANDLPLARPSHPPLISPAFLSVSPLSSRFISLAPSFLPFVLSNANPPRHRYNVASFHPPNHLPTVPLFNLTPTSHQSGTPLVFIIKISIGSKPRYMLQYAVGDAGDIHEKSPKRNPRRSSCECLFLSFCQIP